MYLNQTWEVESDPSATVLDDDSAGNLAEPLVDADNAGHDSAPITGPVSRTTPFEGLFQTGFLERSALSSATSKLSATATVLELSIGGDAGMILGGESEEKTWSAISDEEEDDVDGGDW